MSADGGGDDDDVRLIVLGGKHRSTYVAGAETAVCIYGATFLIVHVVRGGGHRTGVSDEFERSRSRVVESACAPFDPTF